MPDKSLTPSSFADDYRRASERVGRALREYLGDPGEANTRVLRAAIRRQTTMIALVPKRARSKSLKVARGRCRKVLKATSKLRDLDIVKAKLSGMAGDQTTSLLLNNLAEERQEYAADSMKVAWKLFELHDRKTSTRDFRGIARWAKKALEELDAEMGAGMSVVVKNEGKVEELHSLRKQAKRFRYTLELMPPTRASGRAVRLLMSWQDILGEIRDSDTVIEYLGRARQVRAVKSALDEERALRHRRYRAFVRSHGRELKGGSSVLRLAGMKGR